ncbi:hypothetical protein J1N35_042618 [Gossypium stocksii]|uniref:Phorbol-ester/DAG-type domain-containing protein n=1 Tax=Gossypium stocksii TaxID=47602 RepID=A0A9D3U5W0_9ROSI|nr:hypothetical protein J1N35_042618 [Gossypium stocksii]
MRWFKRTDIQHAIHHHPLSFIEEGDRMRWCEGCFGSLTSPTYGCIPCKYFVHKSCLDEHRAEVQSFFHPFPLTICTRAFGSSCFVCFNTIASNFVYKCKSSCRFQTHVECALKPMVEYSDEECIIQHFTHAHPLKLVDSNQKDEVICSICEELCSSSSSSSTYGCMECRFFLHKSCMKRIQQQLINHYIHPCTLIFITDPYGSDECDFCGEPIVPGMKFSCGLCVFDLHVKCALVPTIDSEDAKEIQHFCHPHTLALVQNDEEYGSEPRCVACAQICLASAPTFRCSRSCNHFFLHKSCGVKLFYNSVNLKDPFHPFHPEHPLTIKSLPYYDHIRTCDACSQGIDSTLLAYSCRKSECKFNLHLDCSKLLPSITFSGHRHLLTLLEKAADLTCHLCGVNCHNFVFRCVPCDINIHLQCLPSAPNTIEYKSHLHPLTLTKSPFEYELNPDEENDEFYCDVCEQKRNQRELVYYCAECKFISEVKCVVLEVLPLISNDKSFEEEISKDNITETEIQKGHVEFLQEERIKLRERQKELKAKMNQLEGEQDDVTKDIKKREDLLHDLMDGSSNQLEGEQDDVTKDKKKKIEDLLHVLMDGSSKLLK